MNTLKIKDYLDIVNKIEELRDNKEKILLRVVEEKHVESKLMIVFYKEKPKIVFKSGLEINIKNKPNFERFDSHKLAVIYLI